MKLLARSHHAWIALGLGAAFWISVFMVPIHVVLIFTYSFVLIVAASVALVYFPVFWNALRYPDGNRIIYLALGVVYSWSFSAAWRVWSILWLKSGQDPSDIANSLSAFMQAGIGLGGLYHLASPSAFGGRRWGRAVGFASVVVSSAALALYLTYGGLDTTAFMAAIRPYVPR